MADVSVMNDKPVTSLMNVCFFFYNIPPKNIVMKFKKAKLMIVFFLQYVN